MTTAAQTVEAVATAGEAGGLTLSGLERTMRFLKEAEGQNLIPMSRKGGGKGRVDLQPPHFVNFKIGIMAADTVTQVAAVVPVYRALIPVRKTITRTEVVGDEVVARSKTYQRGQPTLLSGMLPWDNPPDKNLGQALETILLDYDTIAAEVPIIECATWRTRPWVEITFRVGNGVTETHAFGPAPDLLAPLAAQSTWSRPAGVCFFLPDAIIRILSELARNSVRQEQQLSSDAAHGVAA